MKIKHLFTTLGLALYTIAAVAQATGNYDYRAASNYIYHPQVVIPGASSLAALQPAGEQLFSIKGLFNCTADSYLAIFAVTQVGKTQTEADELLRNKVDAIKKQLEDSGADVELFVDMISFLPIYEYEETKKLFSKTTYNEIPKGFELKKNLHFRYKDAQLLDEMVTLCAEQEIYDLVRVDYFIDDIEAKRAQMIAKGEAILTAKMNRYKKLLGEDFSDKVRLLADGFAMHYPVEQYKSYQAYCSNTIYFKAGSTVNNQPKTTSQFYMPKMAKGYDFVINASILEPVVQIEYEIQLRLYPKPKEPKEQPVKEVVKTEVQKQIFFITPDGHLRQINI